MKEGVIQVLLLMSLGLSACGQNPLGRRFDNPMEHGAGNGGAPPAVPLGLTVTAAAGQVTLLWNASPGATAYVVYRSSTSGGPYTEVGTTTGTTFTDTGLSGGTYYYVIQAWDAAGGSGDSAEMKATLSGGGTSGPPAAPMGLAATAGEGQVTLTWNASAGATGYVILRGSGSGGPYTQIATTASTIFVDTGLGNGTAYYYVIRAFNSTGASGDSSEATATTFTAPVREICVAQANNTIEAFDASQNGDGSPLQAFGYLTGISEPKGVYVDTVNNEIAVANYSNSSFTVFARTASGNVLPLRTVIGSSTGLSGPQGVAIDTANNEIAVANYSNASVTIFGRTAYGNIPPVRTIAGAATGLAGPIGVAIDPVNNEIIVANNYNSITIYSRLAYGNVAPLRTISGAATGFSGGLFGLAVDTVNNEILVTVGNNSISVFARTANGNVAPLRTISGSSTGLVNPHFIYVDTTNNEIGVTNNGSNSITVYARTAAGNTPPLRTISGPSTRLSGPQGIAIATATNEIVTVDDGQSLSTFYRTSAGDTQPTRRISGNSAGLSSGRGIAIDLVNNEIGVSNLYSATGIYNRTANANTTSPVRTISGYGGTALSIDPVYNEIVTCYASGVAAFPRTASGNIVPMRTLLLPVVGPYNPNAWGIVDDTVNDELLVTDNNNLAIFVFSRTASGSTPPLRTISGVATGLGWPVGITLDVTHGEIFVADSNPNPTYAITVYARLANGNAAPLRTISGPSTGLAFPVGVALDVRSDEIFVTNRDSGTILVFPRLAAGNVAPSRTIAGPSTGLLTPWGIAVCQ